MSLKIATPNSNILKMWPFNLTYDLFKDEDKAVSVCLPALEAILANLDPFSFKILQLHYNEGYPFSLSSQAKYIRLKDLNLTKKSLKQHVEALLKRLSSPEILEQIEAAPKADLKNARHCVEIFAQASSEAATIIHKQGPDKKFVYDFPIENLNLSVRSYNALRLAGVTVIGEIVHKDEKDFLAMRSIGRKSATEITTKLSRLLSEHRKKVS